MNSNNKENPLQETVAGREKLEADVERLRTVASAMRDPEQVLRLVKALKGHADFEAHIKSVIARHE